MVRGEVSWHRRAARLGWLSAVLLVLAVLLGIIASKLAASADRGPPRGVDALIPVPLPLDGYLLTLIPAAAVGAAALMLGLAATQTAAAMKVLAPERPAPAPLTPAQQRLRGSLPLVDRLPGVETPVDWPSSQVTHADPAHPLRLTLLIPAHDEEAILGSTLAGLREQVVPPHRTIVVADNCTDHTVEIAREHGVEVFETVGNTGKKAGALNQALAHLLPDADEHDVVLVMDADSLIAPHFIEVGLDRMRADPDLIAVGGLFGGEDGAGLLGQLQRNEFGRYRRHLSRRPGRIYVLTGTATMLRSHALRTVAQSRGMLVPGVPGDVYDTVALTEDNELTLALKTLGARLASPPECRVTTEIMSTWRALWRQRLRWQRGALENVGAYGITRTTALYWGQQLGLAYGVVALNSYLLLMTITLLAADTLEFSPLWVALGLVFLVERVATVWPLGWRARLTALPMVLEVGYVLFLQACFVFALLQIAIRQRADWNYVSREVGT